MYSDQYFVYRCIEVMVYSGAFLSISTVIKKMPNSTFCSAHIHTCMSVPYVSQLALGFGQSANEDEQLK